MKASVEKLKLLVAVVSVALVIAGCGGSAGGGPDEFAAICSGPLATPGAAPSAAAGSCAESLGGHAAHLDCATVTDMGTLNGFQLGEVNTHTGSTTDQKVTAISQSGHCGFTVPAGYVAFIQSKEPIEEGLTIADFIPRSGENSVTLLLRCPKVGDTPCLALSMYSSQTYECIEIMGGKKQTLARGTFAGQQFPAPQLEVNKPNRLVFSVKGDAIDGYINGRQICGGKTTVPVSVSAATVQIAQAGGSTPASVDLIDFYIFGSA